MLLERLNGEDQKSPPNGFELIRPQLPAREQPGSAQDGRFLEILGAVEQPAEAGTRRRRKAPPS